MSLRSSVQECKRCKGREEANMSNGEVVLSREQRDEIIKGSYAIERPLREIDAKPRWRVLYVIGTNLAIIERHVSKLPRVSSN